MTEPVTRADDVRAFLTALWPSPVSGELALWRLPDRRTLGWYGTTPSELDRLAGDVERYVPTGNLYVTCCTHSLAGRGDRGRNVSACAVPGAWADLDYSSEAHPDASPREAVEAALAALPLRPSIVVDTGNGIQPWWLLRDPLELDGPQARERARDLLAGWLAVVREQGIVVDPVGELARVLRVPGTMNLKDPDHTKPVRLREVHPGRRYTVADFEAYRAPPSAATASKLPAPGDGTIYRLGDRHKALLSLAGRLRSQGLGATAIRDVLLAFNNRQCDPPQSRADVERIARDSGGWAPGAPGARPCITLPANLEESTALVLARLAELEAPSPTLFAWADGIAELGRAEDGAVRLDRLWSKDKLREAIGRRFDFEHWVRAKQPRSSTPKAEASNG
jgi:hypothetical protein